MSRHPTRRERLAALAMPALLALVACSNAGPPPTNVAFDQPGRFVFACFDTSGAALTPPTPPVAHPLAYCNPALVDGVETFTLNHDLHAIVLQTARGQLGLVDVQPLATAALIDSNPTVPGYTFLAIGDQPVDIVASDGKTAAPLTTYVAHRGSRDIWWIATGALRSGATTLGWHTLPLGAEPTSLALSPDETFLFVALTDLGVVRQYPIGPTGDLGAPTDVLLAATVPTPVTSAMPPQPWQHICAPVAPPPVIALPPRIAHQNGPSPTPSRIVVEQADTNSPGDALIVADSSLPVLHVIPIGAGGLDGGGQHAYNVGSPTSDVVITPTVPANTLSSDNISRYVYALDDRGDVMAVDWTDRTPTQGMVLPAGRPTSRAGDRITFGTPASALAILTPTFFSGQPTATPSCDRSSGTTAAVTVGPILGPGHLRGVFVAVGLFDGTVRIVDVWDSDAFCRGAPTALDGSDTRECAAAPGSDPTDSTVFIRRHRPRVGNLVTSAATVTTAPAFTVGTISSGVDSMGSAGSGLPTLGATSCPDAGTAAGVLLGPGFPPLSMDPGVLICIGVDPWAVLTQGYTATYEGALIGNVDGHFATSASGQLQFVSHGLDFCAATVIGSEEAAGGAGDQLVITGAPPVVDPIHPPADPTACAPYAGTPAVAFHILHSYPDGHLDLGEELDPVTGAPTGATGAPGCFTQLVQFEVRSRQTWTVRGDASGFLSRVQSGAAGAPCFVDTSDASRGLESRATTGMTFVNRDVAFTILNNTGAAIPQGATLAFQIGGQPGSLAVSAGALPVAIQYSAVDGKMYVVDPLSQGLTRILTDGYTVDVHYSNQ